MSITAIPSKNMEKLRDPVSPVMAIICLLYSTFGFSEPLPDANLPP